MTSLARSTMCCAIAMTFACAASAAKANVPSTVAQVLILPSHLANICEADPQALYQAIQRHLQPASNAIDQWAQLVRSFSCDLSGSKDLGWHRVPLRAYESAIRYPLIWVETEANAARPRRQLRTYYSAAQLPQKIDFWVGGRIDEIRYERRLRRLDASFSPDPTRVGTNTSTAACAATTLQFRQQNGIWLLSGVESRC
jgi:hypothetical protein